MGLILLRIGLLVLCAAVTSLLLAASSGSGFSLTASPQFSALFFIPVNAVSLWLVVRAARRDGVGLPELLDFDRSRLLRDLGMGIVWQTVLFIPFVALISLAMLLLFGASGFAGGFELVFTPDPDQFVQLPFAWALASAVVVAVLFPLTNAPAEELTYRRHAQRQLLERGRPAWLAVLLPSVFFGLQHVFLAPTAAGMLAYALAFTGWGVGAAIIYMRSGRLMPVVIAHFLTNFIFGLLPLALLMFAFY